MTYDKELWDAVLDRLEREDREKLGPIQPHDEFQRYYLGEMTPEEEERIRRFLVAYPEIGRILHYEMFEEVDLSDEVVSQRWAEFCAKNDLPALTPEEHAADRRTLKRRIARRKVARLLAWVALALVVGAIALAIVIYYRDMNAIRGWSERRFEKLVSVRLERGGQKRVGLDRAYLVTTNDGVQDLIYHLTVGAEPSAVLENPCHCAGADKFLHVPEEPVPGVNVDQALRRADIAARKERAAWADPAAASFVPYIHFDAAGQDCSVLIVFMQQAGEVEPTVERARELHSAYKASPGKWWRDAGFRGVIYYDSADERALLKFGNVSDAEFERPNVLPVCMPKDLSLW